MATLAALREMGFGEVESEKAVAAVGDNLEAAVGWLTELQQSVESSVTLKEDDAPAEGSIVTLKDEEPAAAQTEAPMLPNSFKCDDCGKLLRDHDAVMFHAAKTSHENFSESAESLKPLTPEERAAKAAELKEKLKEARVKKTEDERREQIEKEKRRREEGRMMLERAEQSKAHELREIAEDRRRQKLEDQKAKQRILDQIKSDREAKKAKEQGLPPPSHDPAGPTSVVKPPPKVDYQQANIQVRLPTGETVRQTFGANEPVSAVRLWIEMNHNAEGLPFVFMIPYPRKVIGEEEYEAPLNSLGLVPAANLIMSRQR